MDKVYEENLIKTIVYKNKITHLPSMISSFSQINSFFEDHYFNYGATVIKSESAELRSSFFLDLIKNKADSERVYVCCSSKYMLEDKIFLFNLKNKYNIIFIENPQLLSSHFKGTFFFYEPSFIWMMKIQELVSKNKQVIIDYSPKETFYYQKSLRIQEINISKHRGLYSFKVKNPHLEEIQSYEFHKPVNYVEFSYFLESVSLKALFERFFGEKFGFRQLSIKNYFPELINIFGNNLRTILTEKGIKSYKFYEAVKKNTLIFSDGTIEINFLKLNLCLNILKSNPTIKIDFLYKIIYKDFENAYLRRPYYNFFKIFSEQKNINFLIKSNPSDFCYLELIELDFELISGKQTEVLKMIPRKIQTISQLKDFFSKITYKYYDNKKFPETYLSKVNHPAIFIPKDFFQLYELKILFRNCVSIYAEDILSGKKIIAKVCLNNVKFCVSLDSDYKVQSIKLPDNKNPSGEQITAIYSLFDELAPPTIKPNKLKTWLKIFFKFTKD